MYCPGNSLQRRSESSLFGPLLALGTGQRTKRDLPLPRGSDPRHRSAFRGPPRRARRLGGDARPASHSSVLLRVALKDLTLLCLPKGKKDTWVLSNKVIRNDGHSRTALCHMGRTSPTPPHLPVFPPLPSLCCPPPPLHATARQPRRQIPTPCLPAVGPLVGLARDPAPMVAAQVTSRHRWNRGRRATERE